MKRFAELLDRLVLTPSRNGKIRLMVDHFASVPDPERGLALAAITRDLDIASIKPAMLRALVEERVDPVLFGYSYDYVGDLAETIALIWPQTDEAEAPQNDVPTLSEVVDTLHQTTRARAPALVAGWLDRLDASGRYALIKLATGGMRIGVSARLAKQALAEFGDVDVTEVEELWHGLEIPYLELFAWLEGVGEKPINSAAAPFRPTMLATAIEDGDLEKLDPADYAAEWKWDGIRVQATSEKGVRRLYTRTGDDISGTFPDILDHMDFEGSLDGELLVGRRSGDLLDDGRLAIEVGTFGDLQQRLNRKSVTAKQMEAHPAFIRTYDLLQDNEEDIRAQPFSERRRRLEAFMTALSDERFDVSPLVDFTDWSEIVSFRTEPPHPVIEGVMLKRWDSAYVPGRPRGPWFKWKRDPFTIDAVLMYAQRGHGKRSSFYSDYTFGVWDGEPRDGALVPVGKAYFGFTDEELKLIDKYVRDNTIDRFGPVRSVIATPDKGLVLEVAFEGINRSTRHKSGVAMRFPRIARLRWDKPAREADRLEALEAMIA